jgi:hypothetical protein
VTAVWAVAFDQLAATDPDALELLTLLAWLGPEPVPLTLLTDNPNALPDTLARTAGCRGDYLHHQCIRLRRKDRRHVTLLLLSTRTPSNSRFPKAC